MRSNLTIMERLTLRILALIDDTNPDLALRIYEFDSPLLEVEVHVKVLQEGKPQKTFYPAS